ncbi:acetylcholine receptor subunit beta-type unc-29-like [Mytilus californianus]|uniref:acetylcholine receptor subunit beta-type unc-29-like n=1 Tax=Mytilus californianus TaxID=6549 RepID=UPI0022456183|nr:acetylcholine receptor subunit beta-type unc-29-like [Mytilus californianus]
MSTGFSTRRGILFVLICIDLLIHSTSYTVNDANKIHKFLFNQTDDGYNKLVLPNYPVTVKAEYTLLALNSLDIKEQIFETSGWFTVVWIDSRLSWTNSSYGNIDYIFVPEDQVWHPELIVQNSIVELRKNLGAEKIVRIQYNGEVQWEPPAVLSTACDMDVTYFPYDSQTCTIELASWGFPADVVNLEFLDTQINLEEYNKDEEWNLTTTSQKTYNITEGNLKFSELLFQMEFKRYYGHYLMSVIFPTILTAVLTFVTFFLPLESGDKIGYILTVLLALAVLLTLFSDSMPTTSKHTSVLVVFLTVTLGMASLVIIFTIFIIRLFHQPEHDKAPKWMHSLARKFLKLKHRAGRINHLDHLDQRQITENDQPKDGRVCLESSKQFTPYTNKELAEFFDYFLFGVFTVLYILVLLCFPIVLSTST